MRWILVLPCLLLFGCGDLGTGASSIAMIFDHQRISSKISNQVAAFDAENTIKQNPAFENSHITVSSFKNAFLILGQTESETLIKKAEQIVKSYPQAKRIFNYLDIKQPITGMQVTRDSWITTKVKSQLLVQDGIDSSNVKVVTEDQTVYLVGIVTPRQAKKIVAVTKQTKGVKRVVKVFRYIVEPTKLAENQHSH